MRLKHLIPMGVFSFALFTAYAEKVELEQLPRAIQDQIRTHTGSNKIEDIDRQTKNGQTTYEVAFKRDGKHTELLFNSQGQLVNQDGSSLPASSKVEFNQLPPAVQQIVNSRIQQGSINDIDRRVRDNQISYEIGFKHDGKQQELLVSNDGRILRDVSYDASAVGAAPGGVVSAQSNQTMLSQTPVQLSSARKIELEQVPEDARKMIQRKAQGARIEDIEMGTWNGRQVYQAAFKANRRHVELQVAQDGTLVHDPLLAATSSRPGVSPRAAVLGSSALPAQNLVPLNSSEVIGENDLPVAVQQALNQRVPDAEVQRIERGIWTDRIVYQFNYVRDGRLHRLQLDQTGKLIHDSRPSQR